MDVSVAGTHALVRKRARSKAESNVRFYSLPPSCVLVHGVILVNGRIKTQTTAGNENNTRHSSSNQNRPMLAGRALLSLSRSLFVVFLFLFPYTLVSIYLRLSFLAHRFFTDPKIGQCRWLLSFTPVSLHWRDVYSGKTSLITSSLIL
jgi:hypothetical protein